jgi:hypothetical protein
MSERLFERQRAFLYHRTPPGSHAVSTAVEG